MPDRADPLSRAGVAGCSAEDLFRGVDSDFGGGLFEVEEPESLAVAIPAGPVFSTRQCRSLTVRDASPYERRVGN